MENALTDVFTYFCVHQWNAYNSSNIYFNTPERKIEKKYPEADKYSFIQQTRMIFSGIVYHGNRQQKANNDQKINEWLVYDFPDQT